MTHRELSEFESETGLVFHNQEVLQEAFIHSSYANEASEEKAAISDNERLEFLGDAVLEFVVSRYLYDSYPELKEGELTRLRAALVRRETLARVAIARSLGEYLVLGKGEEESGGRKRSATLCATYEAVVGALYLDLGLEAVEQFVLPDLTSELKKLQKRALGKDSKSRLQEWSQKEFGVAPRYHVVETKGPDHAKSFVIEVTIHGTRCGIGSGNSKQAASQGAATHALSILNSSDKRDDVSCELTRKWPVKKNVRDILYTIGAVNR